MSRFAQRPVSRLPGVLFPSSDSKTGSKVGFGCPSFVDCPVFSFVSFLRLNSFIPKRFHAATDLPLILSLSREQFSLVF